LPTLAAASRIGATTCQTTEDLQTPEPARPALWAFCPGWSRRQTKKGLAAVNQWNRLRKLWHSGLRLIANTTAILIGAAFLVLAIVGLVIQNWLLAVGAFVTGGPLLATSIGLVCSAINEPEMILCTSEAEIKGFMREFISRGSAVHIASYRLSWVRGDQEIQRFLTTAVSEGKEVTLFAATADDFTASLANQGIRVVTYSPGVADPPRFTFLNLGRRGAEKIAVAREGLPNHWIDVYNDKHHPQIIALAREYIRQVEGTT